MTTHVKDFAKEIGYPAVEREMEFAVKYARRILSEAFANNQSSKDTNDKSKRYIYVKANKAVILDAADNDSIVVEFKVIRGRDNFGRFSKLNILHTKNSITSSISVEEMIKVCKFYSCGTIYMHMIHDRAFNILLDHFPTRM